MCDFRIKTTCKVRTLSSNAPITLTGITCLAHMAAHCNKGSRSNITGICTESNCFNNIGWTTERTCGNKRNGWTNTLVTKPLVSCCKCKFNRNTYIISYSCRCGTRTASKTVNYNNIRTCSCNTGCNCGNIMYCGNFNGNRLFIMSCLLKRPNKLA